MGPLLCCCLQRSGGLSLLQGLLTDEGWTGVLKNEFRKPYFQRLEKFLESEWKQQQVYPARDNIFRYSELQGLCQSSPRHSFIFCAVHLHLGTNLSAQLPHMPFVAHHLELHCRALNTCPLENVKVVILGQDPYHNVGQAMGLSFSVPRGQPVPSSLKNIYTELRTDCQCTPPTHGDLQQVMANTWSGASHVVGTCMLHLPAEQEVVLRTLDCHRMTLMHMSLAFAHAFLRR